jgi:hypothetical protein
MRESGIGRNDLDHALVEQSMSAASGLDRALSPPTRWIVGSHPFLFCAEFFERIERSIDLFTFTGILVNLGKPIHHRDILGTLVAERYSAEGSERKLEIIADRAGPRRVPA